MFTWAFTLFDKSQGGKLVVDDFASRGIFSYSVLNLGRRWEFDVRRELWGHIVYTGISRLWTDCTMTFGVTYMGVGKGDGARQNDSPRQFEAFSQTPVCLIASSGFMMYISI